MILRRIPGRRGGIARRVGGADARRQDLQQGAALGLAVGGQGPCLGRGPGAGRLGGLGAPLPGHAADVPGAGGQDLLCRRQGGHDPVGRPRRAGRRRGGADPAHNLHGVLHRAAALLQVQREGAPGQLGQGPVQGQIPLGPVQAGAQLLGRNRRQLREVLHRIGHKADKRVVSGKQVSATHHALARTHGMAGQGSQGHSEAIDQLEQGGRAHGQDIGGSRARLQGGERPARAVGPPRPRTGVARP
ncbi:MAG: hypothetical protein RMK29_10450 [Myxococcales bacterium]|nr:hypothetical protein [Myxococcota bacterium]MDW8282123.1 hypothetical protein [Myxococcales bacterium]